MYSHSDFYRAYHTAAASAEHIPIHGGVAVYIKAPGQTDFRTRTLSGVVVNKTTGHKYLLGHESYLFPGTTNNNVPLPGGTNVGNPLFQVGNPNTSIGSTSHYPSISQYTKLFPVETPHDDPAMLGSVADYNAGAIAIPSVAVSFDCLGIGKQGPMIEPKVGMKVKYYGAGSGLQRGKITTITRHNSVVSPIDPTKKYIENNKIAMEIISIRDDTGSLLVTDDSKNNVVGILDSQAEIINGKSIAAAGKASVIAGQYGVYFSDTEYKGPAPTGTPPLPTPGPTPIPVPGGTMPIPTPPPGGETPPGEPLPPVPAPAPSGDIGSILTGTIDIGNMKIPVWLIAGLGGVGLVAIMIMSGGRK